MDELTIDGKKYISSKRAAKITGYAKDYVGQLCREGYVEARRVGRNWYVLESAIKDHRFGTTVHTASVAPTPGTAREAWTPPKYELEQPKELPSINLLRRESGPTTPSTPPMHLAAESLEYNEDFHEAWQTWFDTFRIGHTETENGKELILAPIEEATESMGGGRHQSPAAPVPVPIHVLSQGGNMEELRSHRVLETRIEDAIPPRPSSQREMSAPRPLRALAIATLIASMLGAVVLAVIGVGYVDDQLIAYREADVLSGITVYTKP